MSNNETIRIKMQNIATKIQNNRYITGISNGLMYTIPILLAGALFSLLDSINIVAYQNFLHNTGLKAITQIPAQVATNLISIYAVFAIAYALAAEFNKEGFSAGIISLMSFLIVTPFVTTGEGFAAITNIPLTWLGAQGFFVAVIVAFFITRLYIFIIDNGIYIKMPKGVPPIIEKSFAAIVPALIAVLLMLIIRGIFAATTYGDLHSFIYTNLQKPLTSLGGSWWAYLITVMVMAVLWFFGVHGTLVVISVMMAIWLPLGVENLTAFQQGQELPNLIPGMSFLMVYGNLGGAMAAIGLPLAMLLAKSKRYKTLGKLAFVPSVFNINEPVVFGTPLVFNFRLLVPIIVNVLAVNILAILATVIGIVPRLKGIGTPLGTPIIVNGFIEGGWRVAVLQVLLCIVSFAIYYVFFKRLDNEAYQIELNGEAAETTKK